MKKEKELIDIFKTVEIKDSVAHSQPNEIIEMGKSPYTDILKNLTKNRRFFFICFNLVILCMVGGLSILNSFVYFCVALFGNIGAVTYIEVVDRVEKNKNKNK